MVVGRRGAGAWKGAGAERQRAAGVGPEGDEGHQDAGRGGQPGQVRCTQVPGAHRWAVLAYSYSLERVLVQGVALKGYTVDAVALTHGPGHVTGAPVLVVLECRGGGWGGHVSSSHRAVDITTVVWGGGPAAPTAATTKGAKLADHPLPNIPVFR